jgi:hypothetical protein
MFRKIMAGVLLATLAVTAIVPAASASGGKNLAERVEQRDYLSTLYAAALCTPNVAAALTNESLNVTLFGPTNRAFRQLGKAVAGAPITKHNVCDIDFDKVLGVDDALEQILFHHVFAADEVKFREALKIATRKGTDITMADGRDATLFDRRWFRLFIDGAGSDPSRVIRPNIDANNGVLHVINRVIVPDLTVTP